MKHLFTIFARFIARQFYGISSRREWNDFKKRNLDLSACRYIDNAKDQHNKFILLFHKYINKYIYIRFLFTRKANIPNVDFIITTNCTLKCEQCSSLMPFYTSKTHYNDTFETFKNNLDKLLHNVDRIYRFQLIGGEPLLNSDLYKMVEYASTKKQIVYIVTITNGTIIPNKHLLDVYKKYKKKNIISISDYTQNKDIKVLRTREVINSFKSEKLCVVVTNFLWRLRGEIYKEKRNAKELSDTMRTCWQHECTAYCNGQLHLCSRSIAIKRNIDNTIHDYIDVASCDNCKMDIIKLFCSEYVDACNYCHTKNDVKIPRALQMR